MRIKTNNDNDNTIIGIGIIRKTNGHRHKFGGEYLIVLHTQRLILPFISTGVSETL